MAIENDPSARMQVRSRGNLVAPASCMVCGNATCDEGYLDLNVFIDFHGTCYLCMNCITQGGETVGMYTAEQVAHFTAQIESLLADKEALASELANAQSYIDNFNDLLSSKFAASGMPSGDSPKTLLETPERREDREPEAEEPITLHDASGVGGTKLRNITFD